MKKKIFIINSFEIIALITSTYFLQKIIDNNKNVYLYIILQFFLIILSIIKNISFYKTNKHLDEELINLTHYYIFHLNNNFINTHNFNEISYRLNDAFELKQKKLNFNFNIINNIILIIFSFIMIFNYYFQIGIFLIVLLLPLIIICFYIFKKNQKLREIKRVKEANFFFDYKNIFDNKSFDSYLNNKNKLIDYQKTSYELLKFNLIKNTILYFYQTMINSFFILLYHFQTFLSVGSLLLILNLVNFILQPILELINYIISYSNYSLIIKRLKNLKEQQI